MKFPVALVSSPRDFDSLWPSHPPRPTALPSPTAPPQQFPWSPPAILILSRPRCVSPQLSPFEVSHRFHSLVPLHPYSHRDLELHPYSHRDSHRLWPVDSSIRKLLKGGRDLYDSLIAAIIRNLKILKNPYVVQGGFQSWTKQGIRIKELKPETALSILNEFRTLCLTEKPKQHQVQKVSTSTLCLISKSRECLEETEDLSIEVGAKSDKAVTTTLLIDLETSNSTPLGPRQSILSWRLESTYVDPINEEKLRNKSWIDLLWWDYKQRKTLWCWQSWICIEIGRCLPKFILWSFYSGVEKILRLEQWVRQSREEARRSREEARRSRSKMNACNASLNPSSMLSSGRHHLSKHECLGQVHPAGILLVMGVAKFIQPSSLVKA
ncbi:hypothetical protein Fmac_008425 [Flemingia macrophylla]|uniref:Uncharacterized protein n=1 Tax=Flemingia macrophylla TaxID=520843 RepID=A0ABD1MXC3_9FABA